MSFLRPPEQESLNHKPRIALVNTYAKLNPIYIQLQACTSSSKNHSGKHNNTANLNYKPERHVSDPQKLQEHLNPKP
jgi:hypothetical protein